jgi:hypothetical protein
LLAKFCSKDFKMKKLSRASWAFIFDHEVSPLRHIQDFQVRHMVLHLLGWMWAISFSLAIGSYTFMAFSLLGHAVLISALAVTAGTYAAATYRPNLFETEKVRTRG